MKKIVLIPNPYRDRSFRNVREAEHILNTSGIATKICLSFDVDPSFEFPKDITVSPIEKELPDADALICFGGDGTILHTTKLAAKWNIPVLGVNIGTVGFMAELEMGEISLLSLLAEDKYEIDERMMLSVKHMRGAEVLTEEFALNDAVITKGAVARVIQAAVSCDGTEAMNFCGDGVIIATPTGSTAYSMSAGGPIVEPSAQNFIITPICAHDIQTKCIVTSAKRVIDVTVGRIARRNAFLSVDGGRAIRIFDGESVRISRAQQTLKLIKLKNDSFFEIVKLKLGK